jgi:hypothetical protein
MNKVKGMEKKAREEKLMEWNVINQTLFLPSLSSPHQPAQSTYFTVRGQSYFSRLPNYWPPTPLSARRVCTPAFVGGGEDRLAGRRGGWGVNTLEDERNRIALLQ